MGTVCSACKHLNEFGSLSCSNCGKRLFDEDGSESIPDTGVVRSEPGTLTFKGSGNRLLFIGLLFAGAIILVFVLAVRFQDGSNSEAGTVPEQQTANAEQPAQTAFAPAAQEQQADQAPDTEEAKKVEALQRHFRSLPDPQPPVALNKIEGIWWASGPANNKVFAFVEKLNLSVSPYKAELSTSNGTTLVVECSSEFPAIGVTGYTDPNYHGGDQCRVLLPPFTWIRVAMSDVITNTDADYWAMTYRESDSNPLQTNFLVTAICYPGGTCTTSDEAGTRALEKMREKNRRGDN
jgi:hypothetical protein